MAFGLISLSMVVWSLSSIMMINSRTLPELIVYFIISVITAGINAAMMLHFNLLLILSAKQSFRWYFSLLYLPVVVFIILTFFETGYFNDFYLKDGLWQFEHQYTSPLLIYYVGTWILYNIGSLIILLRGYLQSKTKRIKQQRLILFGALLAYVLLALLKSLGLPILFDKTPQGGLLAFQLIWLASIAYLINHYQFLMDTTEAERIALIELSEFNMMICDIKFKIILMNREMETTLGFKLEDLKQTSMIRIFPDWIKIIAELEHMKEQNLNNASCRTVMIDHGSNVLSMDCKISLLYDKWKDHIGYMIIAKQGEPAKKLIQKFDLSLRELEVVQCVVNGCSNKQIAEQLYISERTVKSHLTNIFNKTGTDNRFHLISRMKELQLISEQQSDKDLLIK